MICVCMTSITHSNHCFRIICCTVNSEVNMMGPYLCDSAIFSPCACFRVAAFALVSISFKDIGFHIFIVILWSSLIQFPMNRRGFSFWQGQIFQLPIPYWYLSAERQGSDGSTGYDDLFLTAKTVVTILSIVAMQTRYVISSSAAQILSSYSHPVCKFLRYDISTSDAGNVSFGTYVHNGVLYVCV